MLLSYDEVFGDATNINIDSLFIGESAVGCVFPFHLFTLHAFRKLEFEIHRNNTPDFALVTREYCNYLRSIIPAAQDAIYRSIVSRFTSVQQYANESKLSFCKRICQNMIMNGASSIQDILDMMLKHASRDDIPPGYIPCKQPVEPAATLWEFLRTTGPHVLLSLNRLRGDILGMGPDEDEQQAVKDLSAVLKTLNIDDTAKEWDKMYMARKPLPSTSHYSITKTFGDANLTTDELKSRVGRHLRTAFDVTSASTRKDMYKIITDYITDYLEAPSKTEPAAQALEHLMLRIGVDKMDVWRNANMAPDKEGQLYSIDTKYRYIHEKSKILKRFNTTTKAQFTNYQYPAEIYNKLSSMILHLAPGEALINQVLTISTTANILGVGLASIQQPWLGGDVAFLAFCAKYVLDWFALIVHWYFSSDYFSPFDTSKFVRFLYSSMNLMSPINNNNRLVELVPIAWFNEAAPAACTLVLNMFLHMFAVNAHKMLQYNETYLHSPVEFTFKGTDAVKSLHNAIGTYIIQYSQATISFFYQALFAFFRSDALVRTIIVSASIVYFICWLVYQKRTTTPNVERSLRFFNKKDVCIGAGMLSMFVYVNWMSSQQDVMDHFPYCFSLIIYAAMAIIIRLLYSKAQETPGTQIAVLLTSVAAFSFLMYSPINVYINCKSYANVLARFGDATLLHNEQFLLTASTDNVELLRTANVGVTHYLNKILYELRDHQKVIGIMFSYIQLCSFTAMLGKPVTMELFSVAPKIRETWYYAYTQKKDEAYNTATTFFNTSETLAKEAHDIMMKSIKAGATSMDQATRMDKTTILTTYYGLLERRIRTTDYCNKLEKSLSTGSYTSQQTAVMFMKDRCVSLPPKTTYDMNAVEFLNKVKNDFESYALVQFSTKTNTDLFLPLELREDVFIYIDQLFRLLAPIINKNIPLTSNMLIEPSVFHELLPSMKDRWESEYDRTWEDDQYVDPNYSKTFGELKLKKQELKPTVGGDFVQFLTTSGWAWYDQPASFSKYMWQPFLLHYFLPNSVSKFVPGPISMVSRTFGIVKWGLKLLS